MDDQTGQPIAGAKGSYSTNGGQSTSFAFDEKGHFTIPLMLDTHALHLSYGKDGYIKMYVDFGRDAGAITTIPATYTIRMQRGLSIGGIVQDDAGQPVEGASIQLDFRSPQRLGMGYGHAQTDPWGRWTFNCAPTIPQQLVFTPATPTTS